MATVQFNAYRILDASEGFITIELGIGTSPPFPPECFEGTKIADVQAAFSDYVKRAEETGQRLQLSAFVRSGRKPRGFDAANLTTNVNI